MTGSRFRELRECALVLLGFACLTAALTAPLAFRLGSVAYRISNGDGQFSIWNTAWVARTLVLDPRHVFDANIFYPHRGTLLYSEANLGSGALAIPPYWITGNPYAAHGFVVLLSFLLGGVGTYYLVRYLTSDRLAAVCAGVVFGFSPHAFSHLLHIQLLWTAGLPFSLLAFHRLVDRQSVARAVTLGLAMTAQLYLCAYYAVFLVLIVGAFALFVAGTRGLWRNQRYWTVIGIAGAVSIATALPLVVPFVQFQRSTGFVRPLSASYSFSADWQAYLASSAYAHSWMLPWLGHWNDVLFPGFVAVVFGVVGAVLGVKAGGRGRDTTVMYLLMGLLALWASFGPAAGFYRLLYAAFPAFSLMRVPSRFGLVVLLALAVLAGIGIAGVRPRLLASPLAAALLIVFVVAEHAVPLQFHTIPQPEPGYLRLATLPPGALLELPVYSERVQFVRSRYMLASTIHWMPIVNAYSDYIPADFQARLEVLGEFPSHASLRGLRTDGVRYAMFHLDAYGPMRADLEERLAKFAPYLALRYEDAAMRLYEITGAPD